MKNFRVKMWTAVAILVTLVVVGFSELPTLSEHSDGGRATIYLAQQFNVWEQDITDPFGADGGTSGASGGGTSGASGNRQGGSGGSSGSLSNPLGVSSIEGFLLKILDVILVFATPIIVLFIMYAGFLYVTARGDETKIKTAHAALTWSIVGGVIVLGAQLILSVLTGTINAF